MNWGVVKVGHGDARRRNRALRSSITLMMRVERSKRGGCVAVIVVSLLVFAERWSVQKRCVITSVVKLVVTLERNDDARDEPPRGSRGFPGTRTAQYGGHYEVAVCVGMCGVLFSFFPRNASGVPRLN